ncbi:MAG: oxidoreductase [Phycisphaeraceae bacterium]|nr:oxidoreductase [Phycisphaeraceae bacterium]
MKKILCLLPAVLITLSSCTSRPADQYRFEFTELDTGVTESLRALYVVDENVIWASGTKGTYLVSNNGGRSWKTGTVALAKENDFRSIHAWDENRAMVFGVSGPVFGYLTEDGGDSWMIVYKDNREAVFFNSLKFSDSTHGIALSDPVEDRFLVLRTTDGGTRWLTVKDLPEAKDGEANFAASNSCIETLPSGKAWFVTGGVSARVFYSTDFGKSWRVADTPLVHGQNSTGIFAVAFKNDREGIIVGGDYEEPDQNQNIAATSIDGGATWQLAETMPQGFRSCVQHVSAPNIELYVAVGKSGCDYSTDNGRHWRHITHEGYFTCRVVPGQASLFAAGSKGRIAKIELK